MLASALRPVLLLTVACAVMVGCGVTDDETDIERVVERFHTAIGERDAQTACDQLSDETQSEVEKQEKKPCEQAILSLELPKDGRASETRVYVTSGLVHLAEGGTAFLDKTSTGWRISAVGCSETANDQPYDCELRG